MISSMMVSAQIPRPATARPPRCAFTLALVALSLPALAGCGDAPTGPQRLPVSGTVLQQGKPLPVGSISFLPSDGTTGPAANTGIQNGKYHFTADNGPVPGRHRVLISRNTPKPDLTKASQSLPTTGPPPQSQWEFTENLRETNASLIKNFKLE